MPLDACGGSVRVPEELSFVGMIDLARRQGLDHVADVLRNVLDLDLTNPDQVETYGVPDPIDGDDDVTDGLLSAIIEIIETRLDDTAASADTRDDDDNDEEDEDALDDGFDEIEEDDDGGDEDDPYDVSVDTLNDVVEFLNDVRATR